MDASAEDLRLQAEQRARLLIDRQLRDAGWVVQDRVDLSLFAGTGIAVREMVMAKGHGRVDYLLYVDQRVVGVIEAKPQGTPLSGVEWQSAMYAEGLPPAVRLKALTRDGRLPFVFEASGSETHITNGFDPQPRARRIFAFPQPGTLARIVRDAQADPTHPTWRAKVCRLPTVDTTPLRPAQTTAINGIEQALAQQRFDRSLVQMATGAGKTYTAVTECYRLLKHGGFTRVLFLVDRNNLADQTLVAKCPIRSGLVASTSTQRSRPASLIRPKGARVAIVSAIRHRGSIAEPFLLAAVSPGRGQLPVNGTTMVMLIGGVLKPADETTTTGRRPPCSLPNLVLLSLPVGRTS